MDRQIVWPGAIPLETDLLNTNRNTMTALAMLSQAVLGSSTVASGLACSQTTVASWYVNIGQGSLYSLQNLDGSAYSSLAADTTDQILKQGILLASANQQLGPMSAPVTAGQSVIYLVEAAFSEVDTSSVVLPYYNSSNPAVPYAGPSNTGTASYTLRKGSVTLQLKQGVAATTGTQVAPSTDSNFVPLYYITVAYGAANVVNANIAYATGAPFLATTLGGAAPLASPVFTGVPTAPTPINTDATTKLATTAFVASSVAATYAPLASPALTGSPTAPTQTLNDNSTKLATTAFIQGQGYPSSAYLAANYAPLASPALTGSPTAPTQANADNSTKIATTGWVNAALATIATAAGFASSIGASGYVKLPSWLGGLVFEWGSGTTNGSGVGAITFPLTFPTACRLVLCISTSTAAMHVYTATISSTSAAVPYSWFANTSAAATDNYLYFAFGS